MAEHQTRGGAAHRPSSPTAIACGSLAAAAIACPLLSAGGFTFLASLALLLVASPLLLLFSPLLLLAGLAVASSLAGFGLAGAMAALGGWHLRMAVCSVGGRGDKVVGVWREEREVTESGQLVTKKEGLLDGYFHRAVVVNPPENKVIKVV